MDEKFKSSNIEDAKNYLREILVDVFAGNLDNMPEHFVLQLANANWEMGLRKGDIKNLEM